MKKQMRSPIVYTGGKGILASWILDYFPKHREYIEPFFGGGSVFFGKRPSLIETINDINSDVVNFFRILRDRGDEFIKRAQLTEYSRELYYDCRNTYEKEKDPLIRAWKWWVIQRMSFSGHHSWAMVVTATNKQKPSNISSLHSCVKYLPLVIDRLKNIQIEHGNAIKIIKQYSTPQSLCYCDPPYVLSTRKEKLYKNEMTDDDHSNLLDCLLENPGKVILSGYPNELYDSKLLTNGWQRVDRKISCFALKRTREKGGYLHKDFDKKTADRIESLYLNSQCIDNIYGRTQSTLF